MKKALKKPKRKYIKYIFIGLVLIIPLFSGSYLLFLNTSAGAKQSANLISKFLEKKSGYHITIDKAFFTRHTLKINEVTIYDKKDAQMMYFKEINLDFKKFRQGINTIKFKELEIVEGDIFGHRYKGEGQFNFQKFIKSFQPDKINNDPKKVVFQKIKLINTKFRIKQDKGVKGYGSIDFYDMKINNINGEVLDFETKEKFIKLQVNNLSAIESNGFEIKNAKFYMETDSNYLNFDNTDLSAANSHIVGGIHFSFNTFFDFVEFYHDIKMTGSLIKSEVYLNDLKYFNSKFIDNKNLIGISGEYDGPLALLDCKNLELKIGEKSMLNFDALLDGLPEFESLVVDFDINKSEINFADLNQLAPSLKFPEAFYNVGQIGLNGKFIGLLDNFKAKGNFNSSYGSVKTDIKIKIPKNKVPEYSGEVSLIDLDVGKFTGKEEKIGKVSVKATLLGSGSKINDIQSKIFANAAYIDYNGYHYQNVVFDGNMGGKVFTGKFKISDKNIKITSDGTIDLKGEIPKYNLTANISNADLYKLKFTNAPLQINCMVSLDLKGDKLNNIIGKILILDGDLITADNTYYLKTTMLNSKKTDNYREIKLQSDLATASITGQYDLTKLPALIKQTIAAYFNSSMTKGDAIVIHDQNIAFELDLKQTSFINKMLPLPIVFEDNTQLKGNINQNNNDIRFHGRIPGLAFKNLYIKNLIVNSRNEDSSLIWYSSFDEILNNDTSIIQNISLSADFTKDTSDFNIYFYNQDIKNHFFLRGGVRMFADSALLKFATSEIIDVNNNHWMLNSDVITIKYSPEIRIPYLDLKNEERSIKLTGTISKNSPEPIRIILDKVDIDLLMDYLPTDMSDFGGLLNGQLVLYNILKNPYFDAAVIADPLIFKETDTMGILSLYSNHNAKTSNTQIEGSFLNNDLDNIIQLTGFIDFIKKKSMDIQLHIPNGDVSDLSPFMGSAVSDLNGFISSDIFLKGPLNDFDISGFIDLQEGSMVLNYLKTKYSFSHRLNIDNNGIYINQMVLTDENGNKGVLDGLVRHDKLKNFEFDMDLLANNFHVLNTKAEDNSVYYGQAYASGKVEITGPASNVFINIQLKTDNNTNLYIKAYDDNTFDNYNFIQFVNGYNNFERSIYVQNVVESSIGVKLDIELTPATNVNLIFDPKTNDVIEATGSGNLSLSVDDNGNVEMYGTYNVEGKYSFNALNVRRYDFEISDGSSITWRGDPINANLDITAINPVTASLYSLVANPDYQNKKVDVETKLLVTGTLFSPIINFDFDLTNTGSKSSSLANELDVQQQIQYIKNNEQERNKQVISLLVLKSFLPSNVGVSPTTTDALDNSLNSNVSSIVSAQFSNWISQFSDQAVGKYVKDLNVGVNYQPENNIYKRDFDVFISGNILNGRFGFTGNYDIENINLDFQADYKIKEGSKTRLKVFSKSDNNPIRDQGLIIKQGIGLYYRKEFDNLKELFSSKQTNYTEAP